MSVVAGPRRRGLELRRRTETTVRPTARATGGEVGPWSIVLSAIWFGSVVGLLELGLVLVTKPLRDPTPGFFRMNRHIVWMIPANNILLFGGCGALLALLAWARPRPAARTAAYLFSFFGFLTLLLAYRPLFVWASFALAVGLGYRLGRRILRHEAGFRRIVRYTFPLVGGAVAVLAGGSFSTGTSSRGKVVATGSSPQVCRRRNVLC